MDTHADKTQENKSHSVVNRWSQSQKSGDQSASQFVDNRAEAVAQRRLQETANNSPEAKPAVQLQAIANSYSEKNPPIQKKRNNTGLPDNLKSGIENLSGYSMDDVKVHYNSDKPAQLQAYAYAQGADIHLATGQEKYLPHEAWHVVQQKQGRVKPTMQMKEKVNVNDDAGLENEADVMGAVALTKGAELGSRQNVLAQFKDKNSSAQNTIQRAKYMRALSADAKAAREVASLSRQFTGAVYRHNSINSWVDGFAGMPTTRYNPGQTHYYSPVGYMLETNVDADVLANFSGDGNTNNIPKTHIKWVNAFNAAIAALAALPDWVAWRDDNELDMTLIPVPAALDGGIADYMYDTFIAAYFEEREGNDEALADVAAAQAAIRGVAELHIADHYNDDGQARFLGAGIDAAGMEQAEDDPNVPYTESIIKAQFEQVTAAWYSPDLGNYAPAAAENAAWTNADGDWLAARRASALHIKQQFDAEGANLEIITLNQAADTSGMGGSYGFSNDGDNFIITRTTTTQMGAVQIHVTSIPFVHMRDGDMTYENVDEGVEITIPNGSAEYVMSVSENESNRIREMIAAFVRRSSKLSLTGDDDTYKMSFDAESLTIVRNFETQMGARRERRSVINLASITNVEFDWDGDNIVITIEHGDGDYAIVRDLVKSRAVRSLLLRTGLTQEVVNEIPVREE